MRAGRYELHEVLGAGAFATVYRATDPRLDAPVAVKLLADNWSQNLDVRRRFRSEAVLLRRVQSESNVPGMVNVFDIDETDDGRPFLVMSYADRGTLRERLGASTWTVEDVIPVIDSLAESVGALHRAGVVHRDLKPSNLLLRSDRGAVNPAGELMRPGERLVVGDLGMAKDATLETTALSFAGGTARYMAPEQSQVGVPVDHRADIHAASVIVTELLAGGDELPSPGVNLQGRLPESLDAHLREVLDKGVSTNPDDRHDSMAQWRSQLHQAIGDSAAPEPSRSRVPIVAGSLIIAVLLALAAFLLLRPSDGLEIVGPEQIVVGERSTYRLADGEEATWTDWTGAQIVAEEFDIQAVLPGRLRFSARQDTGEGTQSVEVIESRLGPTINGPETLRLGQEAVFTATLPAGSESSYWIAPDGQRFDSGDFRFQPAAAGNAVVSLVSVDADGIPRGSRQIVSIEP